MALVGRLQQYILYISHKYNCTEVALSYHNARAIFSAAIFPTIILSHRRHRQYNRSTARDINKARTNC